jgi:hypothetical protein
MPAVSTRLRSDFAKRITTAWQKTVKSILEVGHLLLAAKKKLPHGAFTEMVESDLPFSLRTAECLMSIARHPRLAKAHTCASLPPSWRCLYELSRLSDREFDSSVADGSIHAEMTLSEASYLVINAEAVATEKQRERNAPGLPPGPLRITSVATVSEPEPMLRNLPPPRITKTFSTPLSSEAVVHDLEQQAHVNNIIEAVRKVTEGDVDLLHERLTQHRIEDIEQVKQGIEILRRLGERLGGAKVITLAGGHG